MNPSTTIDRLHAWAIGQAPLRVFTILVRSLLALAFVPSGLVKIMGEPFTTLPVSDPVGYFFAGFFSARPYYRFIGVAQWMAAGLLLVPQTATLGALLYLPIILNIFAVTVAIGPSFGGTRLVTGAMLLAIVYLLCWDYDRWKGVLPMIGARSDAVRARHGGVVTAIGMMIAAGIGFAGVTGAHLARLRHGTYGLPLAMIVSGALLGGATVAIAYRGARPR